MPQSVGILLVAADALIVLFLALIVRMNKRTQTNVNEIQDSVTALTERVNGIVADQEAAELGRRVRERELLAA